MANVRFLGAMPMRNLTYLLHETDTPVHRPECPLSAFAASEGAVPDSPTQLMLSVRRHNVPGG
jgi:hypothetical protein